MSQNACWKVERLLGKNRCCNLKNAVLGKHSSVQVSPVRFYVAFHSF